jgi:ABC-type transporter MlaC component
MKKLLALLLLAFAFVVASPRLAIAEGSVAERMAERAVVIIETMSNIVDNDKADCDKMGVDLDRYADVTAAERAALSEYRKRMTPEEKRALALKYAARMQAAAAKARSGMEACGKNAKVLAAVRRFAE